MGDSNLTEQLLKQVEYYFSPHNLPKDAFLQSKMDEKLQVPVDVISGFRKVTELTTDRAAIVAALRSSEVLRVNGEEGEEMVGHRYVECVAGKYLVDHVKGGLEDVEGAVKDVAGCRVSACKERHGVFNVEVEDPDESCEVYELLSKVGKVKRVLKYTREEDEAARTDIVPTKVSRVYKFSQALRPLLIGKHGSNIKKLQEQFPSLSIDTRYDDTSIEITAATQEIVDEVIKNIEKFQIAEEEEEAVSPQGAKAEVVQQIHQQYQAQQQQQALMQKYMTQQQQQAHFFHSLMQQQQSQPPGMPMMPIPTVGHRAQFGLPPHVELNLPPKQDKSGKFFKEIKIPVGKAAQLIGKKGAQKAKVEQMHPSLNIKITCVEHEGIAKVLMTAADVPTVMQAAMYISHNYGLAKPASPSPPEGINININNMIPGGYCMPSVGPKMPLNVPIGGIMLPPVIPGLHGPGTPPMCIPSPPPPNPSVPISIPLNNVNGMGVGLHNGVSPLPPPGHLVSNTPPNMQLQRMPQPEVGRNIRQVA
eukprot:TRINITY_DN6826_c0_g1_i1.p1 TRINITY_DN6826_c0_g1~~TRINITY_DN6826_c0_g1_i1.p1  ORF type:complete len:532 (+),score=145.99 TRINITY_DN6826_c0_g1_i1:52-1647(+)